MEIKPNYAELNDIELVLREASLGRMFILVDDEKRENEGDLIIPAAYVTPEAINFMAKYGRGLICLAMPKERISQLGLSKIPRSCDSPYDTAFTLSIDAREGITTGISAFDRAHTIKLAVDPEIQPHDLVTPGHIFPLEARDGGVLVRPGHTEAAVDIARIVNCSFSSAVICEIMSEDGNMARMPELKEFAKKHKMKMATIADLIKYRKYHEI